MLKFLWRLEGRLFLFALIALTACSSQPDAERKDLKMASYSDDRRDLHSQARPWELRTKHLELDLHVDFDRREIEGLVRHHLVRADDCPDGASFYCDVKALEIKSAKAGTESSLEVVDFEVIKGEDFGDALRVSLPAGADLVEISYKTTAKGTGLQWLAPAQTKGKKAGFLFSQSQAIHARTWFPCQDSPGIRISYEARIHAPKELNAVMSAEKIGVAKGVHSFRLDRPIPSYLIALAVGRIESRKIGPRSAVWAEPEVVEEAAAEFVDTEKMIEVIEGLYGPYRWGRYDILVLPPSFPFGGMENPLLTFATPTILAGDRSLVALIAHELAHSWSGNLVTNATWRDFWLNEGFTVYVEQRVMEALFGTERANMEIMLSMQGLADEMAELDPCDQILHVDLAGRDPDEGFTGVPYDKGAALLRRIEEVMGRDNFDDFLRGWFDRNAFGSVTTADFVSYFKESAPRLSSKVDLHQWIEEPGLPSDAPIPVSLAFTTIDEVAQSFLAGDLAARDIKTASWTTQEWLRFIASLGDELSGEQLGDLDQALTLTERRNSEISCVWLELALKNHYEAAYPRLEEFLTEQGRRKFLKPLYKTLAADAQLFQMGKRIYTIARPLYHAISVTTIDEIMSWPQ